MAMKLLHVFLVSTLALGLHPNVGGLSLSGLRPAVAQRAEDDPRFFPYHDSVRGAYVVTLDKASFTRTLDGGGIPSGGRDVETVSRQIAEAHGAEFVEAYERIGAFLCRADETWARSMSHDTRVTCVEANARTRGDGYQSNPGWGLDRIDQQATLVPGGAVPNSRFTYDKKGGRGRRVDRRHGDLQERR